MTKASLSEPWAEKLEEASRVAHEAYRLAFDALMEREAPERPPERRRAQLAEVVHALSMSSMRLRNIVWWEETHRHREELEVESYEHFRMVTA